MRFVGTYGVGGGPLKLECVGCGEEVLVPKNPELWRALNETLYILPQGLLAPNEQTRCEALDTLSTMVAHKKWREEAHE